MTIATHDVDAGTTLTAADLELTQMPAAIQVIAWFTPLYHGVELIRGLVLGRLDPMTAPWHLVYLLVFFGIGLVLADRSLAHRLAS